MSRLVLHSVCSGYGPTQVLHDVDLNLATGEIVAVLGPNGAGKTTLLNTISGIVGLRRGSIQLDDTRLSGRAAHRIVGSGVVQVPEGRRIFAELTVEENLFVGSYLVRSKDAYAESRDRVFELFPVLGERRRQTAGTLSGGEQQMLAIGRALCGQPRVLMLDEPSMGLAPKLVSRIYESFPVIAGGGVAILLVEQNARKALQVSDRAYVIDRGRVVLERGARDLEKSSELQHLYLGGAAQPERSDPGGEHMSRPSDIGAQRGPAR